MKMKYNMKNGMIIGLGAMLLASVSCHRSDPMGYVDFRLVEDAPVTELTKAKVSDYATLPSTSDFELELKDGSTKLWSGKIAEWDATKPLVAGSYSVSAVYGDNSVEGFSKPAFAGTKSFSVTESGSQTVSVEVKLTNCLVRVACSKAFSDYFTDYSFKLTTASGNVISFPKGEKRAAFIDAYKFSLSGEMTSQGGTKSSFSAEYADLVEATCYTLYFDVNGVGGSSITISFDDSTEVVDLGTVDLNK